MRSAAAERKHRLTERKRYNDRRARGLCGRCGKVKLRPGIAVCTECRGKDERYRLANGMATQNARRRRARAARAQHGFCPNGCGNRSSPGFKLCESCLIRNRTYYHQEIKPVHHLTPGICSGCGNSSSPGYRTCQRCRDVAKTYYWEKGKARRAQLRTARATAP